MSCGKSTELFIKQCQNKKGMRAKALIPSLFYTAVKIVGVFASVS